MIFGYGMMAKAFAEYGNNDNVIIFSQGVSNSQERDEKNFRRESDILKSTLKDNPYKTIVYFGTCSVTDPDSKNTPYVQHKLAMEQLIEKSNLSYFIFRLPQVVGQTNSPTLINFMANKIKNGEELQVWKNSARNLIDVKDVFLIAHFLIRNDIYKNSVTNIASSISTPILQIIEMLESRLCQKTRYVLIEKGSSYSIDINKIEGYLECLNINFDDAEYLKKIIKSYVTISPQ